MAAAQAVGDHFGPVPFRHLSADELVRHLQRAVLTDDLREPVLDRRGELWRSVLGPHVGSVFQEYVQGGQRDHPVRSGDILRRDGRREVSEHGLEDRRCHLPVVFGEDFRRRVEAGLHQEELPLRQYGVRRLRQTQRLAAGFEGEDPDVS